MNKLKLILLTLIAVGCSRGNDVLWLANGPMEPSGEPFYEYRILDHWDNLDDTVERGYAGPSIWAWTGELPVERIHTYGRLNQSIGINGSVLNNVNANPKILTEEYLERVATVGTFIAFCLPMPPKGIPIDRMCKLFYANHFKSYQYQSYTNDATKRAAWLRELIDQYDAFNTGVLSNAMICVAISPEHPFAPEEEALFRQIAGLCKGKVDTMVKGDERLGREMLLTVAFYE